MITLAWIEAQIEETLAGPRTAKTVYDLAALYTVRRELTGRAADPAPEAAASYAAAPAIPDPAPDADRPAIYAADAYAGQAPYIHGASVLTPEDAQVWVDSLLGADGTHGGRWSLQDVRSLAEKRGYTTQLEQLQYWAIINMLHADYCEVARRYGVYSAEFFADLAKAWINDPDAVDDKAAKYLEWVVR